MKHTLFILILTGALSSFAQDKLTPESLWEINRVYGEQVSPDGQTVIYCQRSYDLKENKGRTDLMIVPVEGGTPKRISSGKMSVSEPQWRPDGEKIGFLSAVDGKMQFFEMKPDGGLVQQLTFFEDGLSNFHYAPNMKHISFTQEVMLNTSLADIQGDLPLATGRVYDDLMVRHWTEWSDLKYQHPMIVKYPIEAGEAPIDVLNGRPYDSPMKPFGGSEQLVWAPDGKSLIYVCKKAVGKEYATSTNSELYQYDLKSGESLNLTKGNMGYDNEPVFSNDGAWLAWLGMKRDGFESDKNVVWVRNMATGKNTALTAELDQSFGHLVWAPDNQTIYAISGVDATYQIYELELKVSGNEIELKQAKAITEGTHNINSIQLAGERLIGTMNSMSKPAELYAWEMNGKSMQLSRANTELADNVKMGKVEKRMIKTTDGKDMLTWVIYPPDFDPNKKYPTLLYCQGGPQSAVSQFFSYRWNFQLMAANGYIIVAPNRRGLPTFGQEWNDAISKDWGGLAMKDYLSAIDEMAKEPYVDNDKLGAVGASYGGYSVYYLAGIHEGRFKCFISHCGLFNLESWYASTEELFFANWDIGGPYWEPNMSAAYEKNSPHRMVGNWDTPIMVIHNELDFRVPLNQGLEAFTAAQLQDIPSKLLYYPDEGHWVLQPQNGVMWHREFYDWLDTYLK